MASEAKRRKECPEEGPEEGQEEGPEECPLHEALVEKDHQEVKRLLEEAAVDPDDTRFTFTPRKTRRSEAMPNFPGVSALHVAVILNDTQSVRFLIEFGVNLNVLSGDPHLLTPLEMALVLGNKGSIELLIESGADLPEDTQRNGRRASSSSSASSEFTPEVAAIKLKEILIHWTTNGNSFLHFLCMERQRLDQRLIRRLVDYGLDVNALNARKQTPLHCLCSRFPETFDDAEDVKDAIDILVSCGADVAIENKADNTALLEATIKGFQLNILKKLVYPMVDTKNTNYASNNAVAHVLYFYMEQDIEALLELLFANGANEGQTDLKGCLLEKAMNSNFYPEIKTTFLLKKGFQPDIHLKLEAIQNLQLRFVDLLLDHCSLTVNQLYPGGIRSLEETLRSKTMQQTLNKEYRRSLGMTLHSSSEDFPAFVGILLKRGLVVDLDVVRYYLESGDTLILEAILNHQTNLSLRDLIPEALILLASRRDDFSHERLSLVQTLIGKFKLNPNYSFKSRRFLTSLIGSNWRETWLENCIDYLLTLKDRVDLNASGSVDYQTEMEYEDENDYGKCVTYSKHQSPLAVALNKGLFKVASKLLINFASLGDWDFEGIPHNPGISYPLVLFFYTGYRLPTLEAGEVNEYDEELEKGRKELLWFNAWIEEKRSQVFSLQRMAGNVVRGYHGIGVKDLLESRDFPPKVKSIFLLDDVPNAYKALEEKLGSKIRKTRGSNTSLNVSFS